MTPIKKAVSGILSLGDQLFSGKSLEEAALKLGGGIWKSRTGKIRKWSRKK